MFKNYLLVALRNLKKQKAYSLINILGMAVGMTGFAIFALTAGVKLNADKFHKNATRIFSVVQVLQSENKKEEHTAFTPMPLLHALQNEFPGIEAGLRIYPVNKMTIKREADAFYESNILFVDSNFLSFFTFEMIAGNPQTALARPNSIVLTKAFAEKYFGNHDPIGKVLTLEKNSDVTVTGVVQNVPRTSSMRFDFLISMETARSLYHLTDDWKQNQLATFVLLSEEFDRVQFEAKFQSLIKKYLGDTPESPKKMYLFPFLSFRLDSEHITSFLSSSNRAGIVIILGIGIILLLIVSINFINLSTARYMQRVQEVGVRKVIGARRSQLIIQFISESVLLSLIALPVALILYELIEPIYTAYVGKLSATMYTPKVSNSIWNYPFLLKYLVGTSFLVGIFSGAYPAFFLSKFQPQAVLKGSLQTGKKKRRGSKILIVTQFTLSIILIAFASLLKGQLDHLLKADFGYNRERLAVVKLSDESRPRLEALKTEITRQAGINLVSASANIPLIWSSPKRARLPEQNEQDAKTIEAYGVDYNFIEALEMKLTNGRSFSRENKDVNSIILNESAVKRLNIEDPIGKQIIIGDRAGMVIGVAKDFLFADIGFEIPPAALYLAPEDLNYLLVKYSAAHDFKDIEHLLKEQWLVFFPDLPFDCTSIDDYFQDVLGLVNKISGFFGLIGFVAVFFSCLGLLGLVSYLVEQRTKEICIRKVLGASMIRVTWTMIREFIMLVVLANVIGLSIIHFGWNQVLQTGLLYMQGIGVGTYLFVIFISFGTALVAVTSQTLKVTLANPVESLRYE
ncbi:MAG: ABC transporter permease [Candidatus Zhuqueibacterota bacterium]